MDPETFEVLYEGTKSHLEALETIVKDYEKDLTGEQLHKILHLMYDQTTTEAYFGPTMNQKIRDKYSEESAPPKVRGNV